MSDYTDGGEFDVVIVGAGIAGAIIARRLVEERGDLKVLVLEAGESAFDMEDGSLHRRHAVERYREYVSHFYHADAKVPNSAYPLNPNAASPSVLDTRTALEDNEMHADGSNYWVQKGPTPFGSDYIRVAGGTTMHFLGTALRMVPGDFEMQSRYSAAVDWPFGYDELEPYYQQAELEMGVSAEVEDQSYSEVDLPWDKPRFPDGYHFPMHRIPQSFWDDYLDRGTQDMSHAIGDETFPVRVVSTPQARNGMPNPACIDPRTQEPYQPMGMVGDPHIGERCEGNASCIPICPVQAKYNAMKTLAIAVRAGYDADSKSNAMTYRAQSVVTRVEVGGDGRVTGVVYQRYEAKAEPPLEPPTRVRANFVVLAAHAVENAKILLASGAANSSDQVGRNLMDHPYLLTWGMTKDPVGCYRGPGATSGIPTLRDGRFRRDQAAFRVEIGNWGWTLSDEAPFKQVGDWVGQGLVGAALRARIQDEFPRHVRFGFLIEQLPDPSNRVTIDDQWKDPMGIHRPVIEYSIGTYERAGLMEAKRLWDGVCAKLGIQDHTVYGHEEKGRFAEQVEYVGPDKSSQWFGVYGSGHLVGTHRMGSNEKTSVVNEWQRSHDHDNLYLAGCGSMPTIGTSNPTLTLAALSFRTATDLLARLQRGD